MKVVRAIAGIVGVLMVLVAIAYALAVGTIQQGQPRKFNFGNTPVVMMVEPPNLAGFNSGPIEGTHVGPGHTQTSVVSGHFVRFGRLNFVTP